MPAIARSLPLTAVLICLLSLGACSVDVTEAEPGRHPDVDIRTRLGSLSVRSDADARDTGLPLYSGARAVDQRGERESANVDINAWAFGLKVAAARFDSDDAPQSIVDFYKEAMKSYGSVTECRGDINFKGRRGAKRPVCDSHPRSREVQLVAGNEEQHRMVVVKPRGTGSEFALVYLETRGD